MKDTISVGTPDEIEAIKKLDLPLTEAFRQIVLENRPLIDVRAPVEFEKGAFPHAVNLPLMNNEERHLIGIRYKEQGNASAVGLGKSLVVPHKDERVKAWTTFFKAHPDAYLYCFRGGQRSQIAQAWMQEAGVRLPRLKGGYKAFRGFLMQESERIASQTDVLILGGRTGSGKTIVLKELSNAIDLEGLAHHRGSSFGNFVESQPTQINFEDTLGYALIQHEHEGHTQLIVEDESKNIGRIHIPKPLFDSFKSGKLILLETPMEERVEITFVEYVTLALEQYDIHFGEAGTQRWFDDANASLDRIRKRLGNERHTQIKTLFADAFDRQIQTGDTHAHKAWIEILLREYYDPMYDYQIAKKEESVVFSGNSVEVLAYIASLHR